ncbi:MAG: hypothetical protein WAL97_00180, partial [Halobacteriota archaeon]
MQAPTREPRHCLLSLSQSGRAVPQQYANIIGEIADVFEIEHQGKQAFPIVTERAMLKEDTVLKP